MGGLGEMRGEVVAGEEWGGPERSEMDQRGAEEETGWTGKNDQNSNGLNKALYVFVYFFFSR